jgi:hypothetical protein
LRGRRLLLRLRPCRVRRGLMQLRLLARGLRRRMMLRVVRGCGER